MQFRIVLRHSDTGAYFRGFGEWVTNAYDALTFSNIIEAEEFCRVHALADLQVIQQSGYFFRAPRYRGAREAALAQSRSETET